MLSLFSLTSRFFRPPPWTSTAHSLLSLGRVAHSTNQDSKLDQESLLALKQQDPLAYRRWRYHNDKEFREADLKRRRKPAIREQQKVQTRKHDKTPAKQQYLREYNARKWREDLSGRRSISLFKFLQNSRWSREGWTWKLHEPVITPDRVDRHCTACQRDRFLKVWWATKAEPITYVCNPCFANDFDIVVPEGQHKWLPGIFSSPHLPSPPSAKK
ncbi:unnamed protein product [Aureobasidium vineae]|uniref:Uncharacterized protein n=1 Tax=Aureobasidium vineae TaxID=2773715 RepID=A0A9N8PDE9_9PEZI|nr:unnamed protein product [Aureobasidium vineae]